jgi:hypothetical protein
MTESAKPTILMRISQILKNNASKELAFRLFWVNRSLDGQHKSLVKGIILGIVRALADKKIIEVSTQEYLNHLKEKVRQEELSRLKKSCKLEVGEGEEALQLLPEIEEESKKEVDPAEKARTSAGKPPAKLDFSTFASLKDQEKVQFINKIKAEQFIEHRQKIERIFCEAKGKELAAAINLLGKFGNEEDAEKIKPYFKSDKPDIICAAIKAMSKLDQEFLCLYLPQFMQDKNGKVRMTATRSLVSIDRESIRSLLTSLLSSAKVQQRSLGISTSMLVDFNIVRVPLIKCLSKETSVELVEKIGMVLSANPDRELLLEAYKAYKTGRSSLRVEYLQAVEMIADKLSIVLNKSETPQELLEEAEKIYEAEKKAHIDRELEEKKKAEEEAAEAKEAGVTIDQLSGEDNSLQTILTTKSNDIKVTRAKATIIIWILVAVVWGGAIAILILKFLTGE